MSRTARIGVLLALGLMITGCDLVELYDAHRMKSMVDDAGVTHAEADELSMAQHYRLAEERYEEFNDFYAEVQAEIFDGPWLSIDEDPANNDVLFQAQSPVYWGPVDDLGTAIVLREKAEIEAGAEPWVVRNSEGDSIGVPRQPGDYHPFPDWDAMDQAEIDAMDDLDILDELEEPYD